MAARDKTYINKHQYIELKKWWCDTFDKQMNELGYYIWLYPFQFLPKDIWDKPELIRNADEDLVHFNSNGVDESACWNTSYLSDVWLMKNCDLPFIQEDLARKYDKDKYFWVEELDFNEESSFIIVDAVKEGTGLNVTERSYLYLINEDEDEYVRRVINYGTTEIFKLYESVYKEIGGHKQTEYHFRKIAFCFKGVDIIYEKGKFHLANDESKRSLNFPFNEDNVRKLIPLPKVHHSYDLGESEAYKDDEIFISRDYNVFNIKDFRDFDRGHLKQYLLHVPEYIRRNIFGAGFER